MKACFSCDIQNELIFVLGPKQLNSSSQFQQLIFCVSVQHYLIAIGALIGLPLIIAPSLCIGEDDEGNVARALLISSLFFNSGICTILQTTFGVRFVKTMFGHR